MGNIRPTYIKRVAKELIGRYPEDFNGDYENNKTQVSRYTDISTNNLRNRIAGYITTCQRKQS